MFSKSSKDTFLEQTKAAREERALEKKREVSAVYNADVIALQETWLWPHDIAYLGTLDHNFAYTGKSAMDTSVGVIKGRPYGGVALLWRKDAFQSVSVISCQRLQAVVGPLCGDYRG
ncbi:unnamed protein product [Plutella xylostella]|uniref:(diamondback moth) hypothetical protein n=1 Tax=Plutella xylostella TaxID=51655 RepID=A0A8S4EGU9_PLUXY|nr:unnamed protein product [Plutella xylostella]